ncbi:MAG: 3-deoxy-D-manno-octulosonic acid transferase [Mariprofundaceae bacterium]
MRKSDSIHRDQSAKWKQHLAIALPQAYPQGCVWVHACSVGEVNSIAPFIHWLLNQHQQVHLTVVTRTGMQHAQRLFADQIHVSYLPWDLPGRMAKLINHIQPHLLLLTETEFWPGMLNACKRRDIPIIGINTRLSDRSFPRYKATAMLWKHWLKPVRFFLAQSRIDAERLEALGIEKKRIRPVGNLKYAVAMPEVDADRVRAKVDPSKQKPIMLVASTHHNEEQQILNMWPAWKQIEPNLLLLIVPRHPERFGNVAKTIESTGKPYSRWSDLPHMHGHPLPEDIILIDAIGILQQLYTIADIAIIGGTLVPVGGHNPLEATICGRGVITGPYIVNFHEIMNDMKNENAAIVTIDADDMEHAVLRLLQHPNELHDLHAHAAHFMSERGDVLKQVCDAIKPWLQKTGDY